MQAGLNKEARFDVSTGNTFNSARVIWDGKALWCQYSSPTEGQQHLTCLKVVHESWIFWKLMFTAEAAWHMQLGQL